MMISQAQGVLYTLILLVVVGMLYGLTRRNVSRMTYCNPPLLDTTMLQWVYFINDSISSGVMGPTRIPGSCWKRLGTHGSVELLQSNGSLKIPLSGVYSIGFNTVLLPSATDPKAWLNMTKCSRLGIVNNTDLTVNNIGLTNDNTAHFTAILSAGDVITPVISSATNTNIDKAKGQQSCMIVTLIRRS